MHASTYTAPCILSVRTIWPRDVKTVYFSEPVTGLPKPVFYRLPKGLLWAGQLSPVARRLLSVDRLLLHGGRGPHTRRTGADSAKQRTVASLSGRGRGNRCFCCRELITIVTPLSRSGSAKTAASVCLYSVGLYRKQERSLFTAALEQTSNVPTAIIRPRPTAGLWSPIPSNRSAIASLRRAARLLFDRCTTAPETRPLPAVSRAHPPLRHRPIVQRCPTGGRRWFPGPSSGGRWPLHFPGRAPTYPPPAVLGAPLPAMLIVRRRPPMEFRHRPGTAPGPAGDTPFAPPPVIQLRSCR